MVGVVVAGSAALAGIAPGFAQDPLVMGPSDVAVIPLESVPEWNHAGVIRLSSEFSNVDIDVLAVLKDPREIPIDRFLYSLTDRAEVVVHPLADQIRNRFPEGTGSAVAVYVRVSTPEGESDRNFYDPFHVQPLELQELNDWHDAPFRVIGVASTQEEGLILPCLDPMTIGDGVSVFDTPDTGVSVEPDVYLPPEPHYTVIDQTNVAGKAMGEMDAGEVREGWVLCLAPEVPQDQIRIVSSGNVFSEFGRYGHGFPYWTREEELSAGEWALYEDQVVLAWNGPVELGENKIPGGYEKSVVHEGDVWVSVGQAFRYNASRLGPESDVFLLQLNFEGMKELQDTWDHFAIRDPLHLEVCDGIELEQCELRRDLTSGIREDLYLVSDGGRVVRRVFAEEPGEDPITAWVRIGKLQDEPHFINHRTWKVEIVKADEREGERQAECAPGDCIAPGANLYYYDGEPYRGGDGRLFNDEVAVPIIPLGEQALGLKVLSARVINGSILRAYGLRLSLQTRDLQYPLNSQWLLIEVESTGDLKPDNIIRKNGSDWNIVTNMGLETYYGLSAGYSSIGQPRDSKNRSALQNSFLIGGIPINWQLEDLFIATYSGPVWSLQ
jgi:hypothetical protein